MQTQTTKASGPVEHIVMPLLHRHGEGDCFGPMIIPLDRNDQAVLNHSQSLARLKERGGLTPSEAVAIMLRKKWERLPLDHLTDYFIRFGWGLK